MSEPSGPYSGAYPGFFSIKQLGVLLLPPGWDASPWQASPPTVNSPVPIYTPGWTTLQVYFFSLVAIWPPTARIWSPVKVAKLSSHFQSFFSILVARLATSAASSKILFAMTTKMVLT